MTRPEELRDWAQEVLGESLAIITGGIQRAWGMVVPLQTAGRVVWAKAPAYAFAHEAALTLLLREVAPDRVLEVLAVDPGRGWMLTADGGVSLRDAGPVDVERLRSLIVGYAALQVALQARVDDLLALGLRDLRPARLVEAHKMMCIEVGDPRLPALAPVVEEMAEVLGEHGLVSLEHNDLHLGNVLDGDALRLFDWGDAVVGHPWASLAAVRSIPEHASDLQAAYLDVWGLEAPPKVLRSVVMLSHLAKIDVWCRIDPVGRDPWRSIMLEEIDRWVDAASARLQ